MDDRGRGRLRPGESCWRIEGADRAAFLVDAADYFQALADALERAQRSIWILGWDLHSRLALVRAQDGNPPEELAARLDRLAREKPDLEVRILSWDFAMLYALERESFPVFRMDWSTHERVRFRLDGRHPLGASHHQKIVVVDGALAFVGGIDLTTHRWDTREHRVDEPRRATPGGERYGPFHDVQLAVDGAAARAIEELARERWQGATGERVPATESDPHADPWPERLHADLHDVDVGIARTLPTLEDRAEVREIERAYLDAIGAARESLYIENQYFSSSRIADALAERLAAADGPEVVLVGPERCSGWLEEATMGVLRARLLRRLREADAHGRLRAVCPMISRSGGVHLNVHAKLMVVDDDRVHVGSSNLSNRSLGLDTECDLILQASCDAHREAIRRFRNGLLAEHLDATVEAVTSCRAARESLVAVVDDLASGDRTLVPLSDELEPWIDDLVPEESLVDPESPIDAEELSDLLLDEREEAPGSRGHPIRSALLTLGALLLLAGLWRFTPLGEWLDPARAAGVARPLLDEPLGPVWIVASFVLGSLLMVPVTLMIVVTALLYGPLVGWALALAGAVASAFVGFAIGKALWREAVRRLGGRGLNRLSRMLARRGVLAVAAVRIVPVAPFTVVNLVAGASRLRLRDFLLGTLLAMTPGIAAMTWLSERVARAAADPAPATLLGALGAGAVVVLAFFLVRRRLTYHGIGPSHGR